MILPLTLQLISPFNLKEMILRRDETGLQNVIKQLKEKRNDSPGKNYSRYTREITILNSCLRECKTENAINSLKESNKNY
jgi:hypothetical protein